MENRYKILAVDDEKFNLLLLESCLQSESCDLVTCNDALKAFSEFKKADFDVILLDILMDGIDGFEVRQLIRSRNKKIPIIFLTSLLDDINSTLVNRITADQYSYYLNKSFNKKTLIEKIEQAVQTYRESAAANGFLQKIESDLALAGEVQRLVLPNWCQINDQLISSFLYEPNFKVSGDIFEFYRIADGRHLVVLGDIAGHGVQAALYMMALQAFLKMLLAEIAPEELQVHQVMNRINEFVRNDLNGESYMTCMVALFDFRRNHLTFHNAGHPGLICCSPSRGEAREISADGRGSIPIGWSRDLPYKEEDNIDFDFEDDSIFISYTDGLLDLSKPNAPEEVIEEKNFRELLGALAAESNVVSIPFRLRSVIDQIGFSESPDDVFIMALQKNCAIPTVCFRQLQPTTNSISAGVLEFCNFVQRHTGDEELGTRIELLLSEFLNNVVLHGLVNAKRGKAVIAGPAGSSGGENRDLRNGSRPGVGRCPGLQRPYRQAAAGGTQCQPRHLRARTGDHHQHRRIHPAQTLSRPQRNCFHHSQIKVYCVIPKKLLFRFATNGESTYIIIRMVYRVTRQAIGGDGMSSYPKQVS